MAISDTGYGRGDSPTVTDPQSDTRAVFRQLDRLHEFVTVLDKRWADVAARLAPVCVPRRDGPTPLRPEDVRPTPGRADIVQRPMPGGDGASQLAGGLEDAIQRVGALADHLADVLDRLEV